MVNLKIVGAAALLAAAPLLAVSTADAQPRAGFSRGGGGGGGAAAFRGGGGGMAFRGGGGAAFRGGGAAFRSGSFASRPGFSGGRSFAGRAAIGAAPAAVAAGRPAFTGQRWAGGGRHGHHWRHGRHWRGPGLGFATGLALGSAWAYPGYGYYDPYYADTYAYTDETYVGDDAVAYCSQRYKSYDPASGTYLGYDGQRHPCP